MNFKAFMKLIGARNKEFIRDKGSLTWAIVFPLMIILSITFAFQEEDTDIFKVGVLGSSSSIEQLQIAKLPWVHIIEFDEQDSAIQQTRYHQIDLLLDAGQQRYWINPTSIRGKAVEHYLLAEGQVFSKQPVTGRAIRYLDWVIPGVLGMNIMFGALFGIGYVIVRYRKMMVLKRLQATPVTALEYLSAQVISRLIVIVGAITAIFTGCHLFLDFLVLGSYALLFLVAVLGALSMVCLGLVIASRTDSEELAGGMINFATFPMLLLSEVWFSLDGAPEWLKSFSDIMPLTHMVRAARIIMLEGGNLSDIAVHLWVLAITSVICLLASALLFRWTRA